MVCIIFEEDIQVHLPKLFNYLDDGKDNIYEGEWELEDANNYELYFYKYIPEKKTMYITKGDNGNSLSLLYKDIEETFVNFKYTFLKKEELTEELTEEEYLIY